MRYQGRISEWQNSRGFGFIAPNGGGPRVFLHISAFSRRDRTPEMGDLVTYEVTTDDRGRNRAGAVRYVGERADAPRGKRSTVLPAGIAMLFLAFALYVGYVRISHPNSTMKASVYKVFLAREALVDNASFRCEPAKSSCSHMSSCAEAFFHQERCGVSKMDGDRDGIPCEQQLCR